MIICCFLVVMLDGFDTALGFIAPDIRLHWQLSAGELAPLFGAGLLGLTAGALLCGPLSDRFGRKRVIEFCVALFGLFSLLSAFSTNLEMLVILRFLTGLGLGGAMPNTITMTSEYLPARRRGALVTLMFSASRWVRRWGRGERHWWRTLAGTAFWLWAGSCRCCWPSRCWVLPESPRWQVRRGLPQPPSPERSVPSPASAIPTPNSGWMNRRLGRGQHWPAVCRPPAGNHSDALGGVLYEPVIIYLLSSWMPSS
ncbi:MFS transporter [Klebsiella pneumoniae]|uniref:MFS transporter n=1 Tax=Klebsiella pneumoniae TaxID=573 RepID=UPI00203FDA7E|nr:MFS transporter [Klebsiella pneumoniae]